jgi:hypothetical protein
MKNVILFVIILTVMGSLKKPDTYKVCPTVIQVQSFYKGKLQNTYASDQPTIKYERANNYTAPHGKIFRADSISFTLK